MQNTEHRKRIAATLLLFLFALFFTGCGAPKKDSGGAVTLTMWVMPNSLEPIGDLENLLKPFLMEHPNIKIDITSVDWGAAWTKITTASVSGDVPDIVQIGSTWVGSITSMGALKDLSGRVKDVGGGASFVPVAWTTSSLIGSNQITAIPWFVDARALFYRTDVFRKGGLNLNALGTWDGFRNALAHLKEKDILIDGQPVAPLGLAGKNDWNVIHSLSPWIWAAGGSFYNETFTKSALDSPEVLKGVLFFVKLVESGYVPLEYLELNTAQVSSNFNNGSSAMYFDGPYEVKTLTAPPGQGGAAGSIAGRNFAVMQYPSGPKGQYTFVGGSNLAIFKNAKHPDEAWEVIKYLTQKDAQVAYAKVSGFLPAKKEAFDDPFFTQDPHRKVFKEAVKYGRTYPCVASWGLLEPILTRRFGIMWDYVTGSVQIDPDEIHKQLKLATSEMNAILKQQESR